MDVMNEHSGPREIQTSTIVRSTQSTQQRDALLRNS